MVDAIERNGDLTGFKVADKANIAAYRELRPTLGMARTKRIVLTMSSGWIMRADSSRSERAIGMSTQPG